MFLHTMFYGVIQIKHTVSEQILFRWSLSIFDNRANIKKKWFPDHDSITAMHREKFQNDLGMNEWDFSVNLVSYIR